MLSDITDIIVQIKDGSIDALTDIDLQKLKDKIQGVFPPFGENGKPLNKTKFGEAGVLANFKLELESVGGAMENIVVNGFTKMEDALVQFVMTGKLSFRDLANSVISDLTRMFVRAAITKPLFSFLFPNLANGGVIDSGKLLENAKGNIFGKNKVVPFAYGGIVSKPTLFPMRDGMGLMGEAGPEAVIPLKRTRQGRLGVESSGGGSNNVVVNVDASNTSAQGNTGQAEMLGKMLAGAVQDELLRQQRPGGLLYR